MYAAFLILPALFALQSVVSDRFGKAFRNTIALGIIALAILLAFSRAAWGGLILTSAFMLILMIVTSRSPAQRSRIILIAVATVIIAAVLLAVLYRSVRSMNCSNNARASIRAMTKAVSADLAAISSAPRWRLVCHSASGRCSSTIFSPEDTHNSYLNAFMSGGWLSGICYPALVFHDGHHRLSQSFHAGPVAAHLHCHFRAFLGTVGEAFIIDTDHWRHFWLMMGSMWGMFVAAQPYKTPGGPLARGFPQTS